MLGDADEELDGSPHAEIFASWLLYRWSPQAERTPLADMSLVNVPPARAYLQAKSRHVDPIARRYLEAALAAPFAFYEIVDSCPGQAFRAREVIIGEECEVREWSTPRGLPPGEIVFALLVCCDGVWVLDVCARVPIPTSRKQSIVDLRERIPDRSGAVTAPADMLAELDTEFRTLYLAIAGPVLDSLNSFDSEWDDIDEDEDEDFTEDLTADEWDPMIDPDVEDAVYRIVAHDPEAWINERISALGGKTPLQAVKDPEGREFIEALVTDIEHRGRELVPPIDESVTKHLRKRLGLGDR